MFAAFRQRRTSSSNILSGSSAAAASVSNLSGSTGTKAASKVSEESEATATRRKQEQSGWLSRGVWASRLAFLVGLAGVAALLTYGGFALLRNAEVSLAERQFAAVADRALSTALSNIETKRLGAKSLATTVALTFPNATDWPFVHMDGFPQMANSLIETTAMGSLGFSPRVTADQLSDFENFVHYQVWGKHGLEFKDYQQHVTGFDESNNFQRYNETDGKTIGWDSNSSAIWPYSAHSFTPDILLYNLHSLKQFGVPIDELEACAINRNETEKETWDLTQCALLTGIVEAYDKDGKPAGPSAFIYQPIFPGNNPEVMTGLISSGLHWERVVTGLFTTEVSGVDCVLSEGGKSFTWHVTNGNTTEKGYGELFEPDYEKYGVTIDLYSPDLFSHAPAKYTLTAYPSDEFFAVYQSKSPLIALFGAFGILLFVSILYLLYDYYVRKEFHHKSAILQAKRQYVRFISHEVRTPLNAVVMGSNLVRDDMVAAAAAAAAPSAAPTTGGVNNNKEKLADWTNLTGDILANSQSAVNVLNDLLNYDKVESGTLNLELTYVPIWSLIRRTADEFKLSARSKDIDLQVDLSKLPPPDSSASSLVEQQEVNVDDLEAGRNNKMTAAVPQTVKDKWVIGDSVRITQILRNFLSNAVKFTPDGGNVTVRVWCDDNNNTTTNKEDFVLHNGEKVSFCQDGFIRVDVSDSGAGMTEEQLENVFKEGVQFNVNQLQAGQGSGLGLFIAQGIARQHNGELTVASKGLGKGTTFTVTLPLFRVPESDLPDSVLRARKQEQLRDARVAVGSGAAEDPPMNQKYKLLVVDDTVINRKLLSRILRNKGHECDEAENGAVAVDMVKQAMEKGVHYDTILMDYEMPVMKGPEACEAIRDLGCDSLICGITGNCMYEDVKHFKEHGANQVLGKPLNVSDLEDFWALNM